MDPHSATDPGPPPHSALIETLIGVGVAALLGGLFGAFPQHSPQVQFLTLVGGLVFYVVVGALLGATLAAIDKVEGSLLRATATYAIAVPLVVGVPRGIVWLVNGWEGSLQSGLVGALLGMFFYVCLRLTDWFRSQSRGEA